MPLLLSSTVLGLTASRKTALSFSAFVVFAAAFLQVFRSSICAHVHELRLECKTCITGVTWVKVDI